MMTDDSAPIGFMLNASGPKYRRMLKRAVRSVRAHHPDIPIDVYVDTAEDLDLPEADRVHVLPADITGPRPRFHALRQCRFDRVVMLDVDLLVVAPVDDIFDVLQRFDIAAAHDNYRNGHHGRLMWRTPIPDAFPQVNCGVLGLRMSPQVKDLIDRWEAGFDANENGRDQPAMRELLWSSPDLRLAVLPVEFNFWDARQLDRLTYDYAAPRIIHNNLLSHDGLADAPIDVALLELLGHARVAWLRSIQQADEGIAALEGRVAHRGAWKRPWAFGFLRDLPRKARSLIRKLR